MSESDKAARNGPLCRVALGLSYDGSHFHGFAAQSGVRTVSDAISDALLLTLGFRPDLTCAGRTDKGVHARAQVVHFDTGADVIVRYCDRGEPSRLTGLARSLTSLFGPEIVVWRAVILPRDFDARRSALARRYRYEISTSERLDPFLARTAWQVGELLDLKAMRSATKALVGEHDFAGFCRRPKDLDASAPITRRVLEASWSTTEPDRITFEIEAQSFCHQMVRSVTGALVAIGRGRAGPREIAARLSRGDREGSPTLAPPGGLFLIAVRYRDEFGGTWE